MILNGYSRYNWVVSRVHIVKIFACNSSVDLNAIRPLQKTSKSESVAR
jgi:hypothetical protein